MMQVMLAPMYSQSIEKRDYVWLFGGPSPTELLEVDFKKKPGEFKLRSQGLDFNSNNSSIANLQGDLLFYSNGCAIADSTHQIMPNGDSINAGAFFDLAWLGDCNNGYPGRQDIIILPDPDDSMGYYTIHKTIEYERDFDPPTFVKFLKYSYVNMRLNLGKGDVVEKNKVILESEFLSSYLSAIRHSNMSDWWIIQPKDNSNTYYSILLDADGFTAIDSQNIGLKFDPMYAGSAGESRFSPDGKMFAYFNLTDGLYLFDFDREDAQLSNFRHLNFRDSFYLDFGNLEFSPDSRLLYVTSSDTLWQIDLSAEDLEAGREVIDVWNGSFDPLATKFSDAILAPDCKLYIRPRTGVLSMHVINHPNLKGKACDFQQQAISIPAYLDRGTFPNFPRYRVDEEVCDSSLTSIKENISFERRPLNIYPNPSRDLVHLDFGQTFSGQLQIFDIQLKKVIRQQSVENTSSFKLMIDDFPEGQYFVQFVPFNNTDRIFYTGTFVKVE